MTPTVLRWCIRQAMQMMYEVRRPQFPMVWMLIKAAVDPRGMRAKPQPISQVRMTAFTGMFLYGETLETVSI